MAVKSKETGGQVLPIDSLDARDESKQQRAEPVEELISVPLDNADQVTYIRSGLSEDIKGYLIQFLRNNCLDRGRHARD